MTGQTETGSKRETWEHIKTHHPDMAEFMNLVKSEFGKFELVEFYETKT